MMLKWVESVNAPKTNFSFVQERTDMDIPIFTENAVEPVIAVAENEAGKLLPDNLTNTINLSLVYSLLISSINYKFRGN